MLLTSLLHTSGIDRLDAELLLGYVLQKPRTWLLAHPEFSLSEKEQKQFEILAERRKNHEPIAYILGEKEFYGRKFFVDNRVLIPRPATEVLIDETKKMWNEVLRLRSAYVMPSKVLSASEARSRGTSQSGACTEPSRSAQHDVYRITPADSEIVIFSRIKKSLLIADRCEPVLSGVEGLIADIGTGSGCIGITLALEIPEARILCTDISEDALEVAKENAARHGVSDRITFEKADLHTFTPSHLHTPFLIVSNPPYIPSNTVLPSDVKNFEPHEALFAGGDGMDILTPLFEECLHQENCLGCILECREEQAKKLSSHS